jgi:hypothetical protein
MHTFIELIDRCTAFTLETLREAHERTIDTLRTSAETTLVKALQMIQLKKVILAVGMFSLFEVSLQDGLSCKDGFREAHNILDLQLAINVLKHGRGGSYDALVAKAGTLNFRVKLPGKVFYCEGDVSEVSALIEADDTFVFHCAAVIREVSEAIRKARPEFLS